MRKLEYTINLEHLRNIKPKIVPIIFTEHQYQLILKKFNAGSFTPSEKNEFSRTISRKMKAIYALMDKSETYVYGKEKIMPQRLKRGISLLKKFSRKFKNKHILISGSFLHSQRYQDIDVFIVSQYEKEDIYIGKIHFNYLTMGAYNSLFFHSLSKLCLSNKEILSNKITEKVSLDIFISLFQELCNDLDRKFAGVRKTLREFLLQAAFISKSPLPDSLELKDKIKRILTKNPLRLIQKIFIEALLLSSLLNVSEIKKMILAYQDLSKEYPLHQDYYQSLINTFQEVLALES